jgi:arabinofuranan 3-O-arabinosyltransferase
MSNRDPTREDQIFTPRRLWLFGRLIPSLYLFMAVKFLLLGDWLIAPDGSRLWTDFLSVWSAGVQTRHTGAASVYGIAALDAVQKTVVGNLATLHLPFAYPPPFLLVAVPLSTLPYVVAFLLWQALTITLYAAAIYLIIPRREAVVLALAFPVVFANAFAGQEGLLAAALLAAALALQDRRPVVAGIILGLLTFRPQLGMVFPIVLLITGRWRTILSATTTALCLAGASLWCFGAEAWRSFLAHAPEHAAATLLEGQTIGSWAVLQSVFALMRTLGGTVSFAWISQIVVAAVTILAVAWLWRQPARQDLKAAALALGASMVTPYLYYYDLCILAVPAAFLIADGLKCGFARFERFAILACAVSTVIFVAGIFAPFGPFIMAILVAVTVVRLRPQGNLSVAIGSDR